MQLLRFTLLFWRTYLVRTLLTKRMALVALGCCAPPAIAWFALTVPRDGPLPIQAFMFPSFLLVLQLAVPLASVIGGSAVISEELDDRTITYLLTRPVPRPSILLGRWLATLTILLVFVGASVGLLGAVVEYKAAHPTLHPQRAETTQDGDEELADTTDEQSGGESAASDETSTSKSSFEERRAERASRRAEERRRRHDEPPEALVAAMPGDRLPSGLFAAVLTAALLGTAVYSALFAVLGTFLKHPMIVGLGYAFAIEGFLANLPGVSQSWTVQYYLRSYLLSKHPALWAHIEAANLPLHDTANQAVTKLAIFLVVTIVVGCILIRRKQYVLSA